MAQSSKQLTQLNKTETQLATDDSQTKFTQGEKIPDISSPLSLPPPSTSPSLALKYPPHLYKSNSISSDVSTNILTNSNASCSSLSSSSMQLFRNSNSIESLTVPSPAGSLEQFDLTATPLSVDDGVSNTSNLENAKESSTSIGTLNNRDDTTILINNPNSPTTLLASPSSSSSSSLVNPFGNATSKTYDSNSPSFRFRRHSSQSSLPQISNVNQTISNANPNLISPLTINNGSSGGDRSICSSPINSLKMSSRVCQIKIDEGIELHLSREIKSERDTQSTLKLKTSCDELMLNSDELDMFSSFEANNNSNRNNTPSPSLTNSNNSNTFRRYRTFSESLNNNPTMTNVTASSQSTTAAMSLNLNMPSPSMSSFHSYSNSSSPTADLIGSNPGSNNPGNSLLLRCFSPSSSNRNVFSGTSNNNSGASQNYFSKSPSPTRKLFVARRSMSPVPYNLRPSSLVMNGNASASKRKYSDLDQGSSNNNSNDSIYSPKRLNNNQVEQQQQQQGMITNTNQNQQQQEFVEPLLIFTGNNSNGNNNNVGSLSSNGSNVMSISNRSSPLLSSPLAFSSQSSSSSHHNNHHQPQKGGFSSLVITAQTNNFYNSNNTPNTDRLNDSTSHSLVEKEKTPTNSSTNDGSFAWPKLNNNNSNERQNKYTFIPIQLPSSPSSSNSNNNNNNNNPQIMTYPSTNTHNQSQLLNQPLQHKRLTAVLANTNTNNTPTNASLQINPINSTNTNVTAAAASNANSSPISYFCESPLSYSPSVSIVSSSVSVGGDKPDSGYQSSIQNNSDSESCI